MVKINDVKFSDIYITPDRIAFIPDGQTKNGLTILDAEDFDIFYKRLEEKWDGHNPSYSLLYENIFYRVERTESLYGTQYCARKMPEKVPPFGSLGFPARINQISAVIVQCLRPHCCGQPDRRRPKPRPSSLLKAVFGD